MEILIGILSLIFIGLIVTALNTPPVKRPVKKAHVITISNDILLRGKN